MLAGNCYVVPSQYGPLYVAPPMWYCGTTQMYYPPVAEKSASLDLKQIKISVHAPCERCKTSQLQKYQANGRRFTPQIKRTFIKSRIIGISEATQKFPEDWDKVQYMVSPPPLIYATRSSTFAERALVFSVARMIADNNGILFYCTQLGANVDKAVRDTVVDMSRMFDQHAFELLPEYLRKMDYEDDLEFNDLREQYDIDAIIKSVHAELANGITVESLYVNMHEDEKHCLEIATTAQNTIKVPVAFVRPLRFRATETPVEIESPDYEPFLFAIIGDVIYAVYDSVYFNISYLHQKLISSAFICYNLHHIRCIITTDTATKGTHVIRYNKTKSS